MGVAVRAHKFLSWARDRDDYYFYNSFKAFVKAYADLVQVLNPKLTVNILSVILSTNYVKKTTRLKAHLIASNQYLQHLIILVKQDTIRKYKNQIDRLISDYYSLFKELEDSYPTLKYDHDFSWRKTNIEPDQAIQISKIFFQDFNPLKNIYGIADYSIMALRQSLELYAKNILGIHSIVDKDKSASKNTFTKPWEFILFCYQQGKVTANFNIEDILTVFKWTNRFVHTGISDRNYIIFKAIDTTLKIYPQRDSNNPTNPDLVPQIAFPPGTNVPKEFTSFLKHNVTGCKIINWVLPNEYLVTYL